MVHCTPLLPKLPSEATEVQFSMLPPMSVSQPFISIRGEPLVADTGEVYMQTRENQVQEIAQKVIERYAVWAVQTEGKVNHHEENEAQGIWLDRVKVPKIDVDNVEHKDG